MTSPYPHASTQYAKDAGCILGTAAAHRSCGTAGIYPNFPLTGQSAGLAPRLPAPPVALPRFAPENRQGDHRLDRVPAREGRMRLGANRARHRHRPRVRPGWAVSALAAPVLGALLLSPPGHAAASLAVRLATAAATVSRHAPAAPRTTVAARAFAGTPEVGALFRVSSGRLGRHFCTASVVDSRAGDLVITAAHCVSKLDPATVAFVPGFRQGKMPYGV